MKKKMFKNMGIKREILYYILKNKFEILKIIVSFGVNIPTFLSHQYFLFEPLIFVI